VFHILASFFFHLISLSIYFYFILLFSLCSYTTRSVPHARGLSVESEAVETSRLYHHLSTSSCALPCVYQIIC
jgi:hypothetical protein